jgi:hypothetical protein
VPHWKLTVTLELFQPAEFAAGEREVVIVGGVASRLTITGALGMAFPALSVAVAEMD